MFVDGLAPFRVIQTFASDINSFYSETCAFFKYFFFKIILRTDILGTIYVIGLRWIPNFWW